MADKKQSSPDWEDVRVFVGLARYGSLSATARALGLTHATVSRRVRALEQALQEKLLQRRPDGYRLTAAGERMIGPAIEMEAAAGRLQGSHGASGDPLSGLVRVNAPPSLTQAVLVPGLARLAGKHPGLQLDIVGDVRTVSLERRETDLGLRYEKPDDGDVIAKQVAEIRYGWFGTRVWLRRLAQGAEPQWIGFDEANAHLPEARWLHKYVPRAQCVLRANNHLAQAAAAATGLGIALLPQFVVHAYPQLKPCMPEVPLPARELWLVKRRLDRHNLAVQAVWDYLTELFAEAGPLERSRGRSAGSGANRGKG